MNAIHKFTNITKNEQLNISTTKCLIDSWGWDTPPDDLMAFAEATSHLVNEKAGKIIAELAGIEQRVIEDAVQTKPERTPLLEHLIKINPHLGGYAGKAFAAQEGVAWYETIPEELLHDHFKNNPNIAIACNGIDAVLIETDNHYPVVVFSDINNLREFQTQGRAERLKDPIRRAYGPRLLLGMCPKRALLQSQHHTAARSNAAAKESQRDQVNYWTGGMADSEAMRILAQILDTAVEMRVTDVAIEPMSGGSGLIQYRQNGDLITVRSGNMVPPETLVEISRFLMARSRANPEGGRLKAPADGQIVYGAPAGNVFVRCSFIPVDIGLPEFEGVSCALRLLSQTASNITLTSLNLPDLVIRDIRNAIKLSSGIVLMVGPTGSGKSTTIAGMLGLHVDLFGDTKKRLSIEDPIERYIPDIRQFSANEGQKDGAFARAIKAFMRHDPDLIWVGEIRDPEAAMAATRAANTGHLVMTTFHANDTVLGYKELADMLDRSRVINLIESLSLVLSQRLVKKLCPKCSTWSAPTTEDIEQFNFYIERYGESHQIPEKIKKIGPGCPECNGSGVVGRIPLLESLPCTRKVKNLMRAGLTTDSFDYEAIAAHRTFSLLDCGLDLAKHGHVELKEIFD